jgi:hypothetical protein
MAWFRVLRVTGRSGQSAASKSGADEENLHPVRPRREDSFCHQMT